jgi:HAD superfamily hydrolase (TIGR01509 family)
VTARVALIDLFDTLVWSEWTSLREQMEARLGLPHLRLLDGFLRTQEGRGTGAYGSADADIVAVLESIGVEPTPDLVTDLRSMEREHLATGIHLHDDALPALRGLRDRGVPTVLVSNCSHGTRDLVERLGLVTEMDAIVLSYEIGSMKPSPGIYLAGLEALDATADEAVFVDDNAEFVAGAEAVGIPSLRIDREADRPGGGVITSLTALLA